MGFPCERRDINGCDNMNLQTTIALLLLLNTFHTRNALHIFNKVLQVLTDDRTEFRQTFSFNSVKIDSVSLKLLFITCLGRLFTI